MTKSEAVGLILAELERAEVIYPIMGIDLVHRAAIVAEEAGELLQKSLDHFYIGEPLEKCRKEAIQTGAMAIRYLVNLEVGDEQA
jgi:hypothetical protein